MMVLEETWQSPRPDLVIVVGDVSSTLAATLVAAKMRIPAAHMEAGLRSFDREMPEEINRVVADHLSDLLFTTWESGNRNLQKEGIAEERVHLAGNCMVNSLFQHLDAALAREPWGDFGLPPESCGLVTLHRRSNVDDRATLKSLLSLLAGLS